MRAQQSRDLAVKASVAAEQSRDEATAATRFLRDMVISNGSSGTAQRSRLEPTIKRLDEGWLANQPETAIGCRVALGFALLASNPAESERQFDAGLALARTRGIDTIPELSANIYEGLGRVYAGRKDAIAEKYLRESAADFQRFKTPSSQLGEVYSHLSRKPGRPSTVARGG